MTVMQKRPSAQQVAIAWCKSLSELEGIDVASTLAPVKSWTGQDFVVVGPSLGGIPSMNRITRVPVVQLDVFAKAPNSARPAWNRASMTAEAIRDACYGSQQYGVLEIPGGFMAANLHSVSPMSEPRRMQGDVAAMARYSLDIELVYDPAALVVA
jgi:hypothetical protein